MRCHDHITAQLGVPIVAGGTRRVSKAVQFGKYHLLERIAAGGMAEVFKAKVVGVTGLDRLLAVKRILPAIAEDPAAIAMFLEEAKLALQLTHPNIAQAFDLGRVDQSYFIALEFVRGRDLATIFERCRGAGAPMSVAQACYLIMQVCQGLDYAHTRRDGSGRLLNLVHRDVTPQNVLVSYEGDVKLIDFGIAKVVSSTAKTRAGAMKGKLGYLSPEQLRGQDIDRRADVFSLSVILYELLTGEQLFVAETDFLTVEKLRDFEVLPPSAFNPRVTPALETIVFRALAREIGDRYQSARELHRDLADFVSGGGEDYGRERLGAWMQQTFATERAEEERGLAEQEQELAADLVLLDFPTVVDAPLSVALAPVLEIVDVDPPAGARRADAAAAEPVALLEAKPRGARPRVSPRVALGVFAGLVLVAAGLGLVSAALGYYSLTWSRRPASLVVTVDPPEARVVVDDRWTLPARAATARLAPGPHVIAVSRDGYVPALQGLEVRAGHDIYLLVKLARLDTYGIDHPAVGPPPASSGAAPVPAALAAAPISPPIAALPLRAFIAAPLSASPPGETPVAASDTSPPPRFNGRPGPVAAVAVPAGR